jgi:hypothetical protein
VVRVAPSLPVWPDQFSVIANIGESDCECSTIVHVFPPDAELAKQGAESLVLIGETLNKFAGRINLGLRLFPGSVGDDS